MYTQQAHSVEGVVNEKTTMNFIPCSKQTLNWRATLSAWCLY
jgi:hypothetical protein